MSDVIISKKEYEALQHASLELAALEIRGVENWPGYWDAVEEVKKKKKYKDDLEDEITNLLTALAEFVDTPAGYDAGYNIGGDEPYDKVHGFLRTVEHLKKEAGL